MTQLPANPFANAVLSWQRLRLTLAPLRTIGTGTPALVVLNALLKSVKAHPAGMVKRAFRVLERKAHTLKLTCQKPFVLEIVLISSDAQAAERELAAFDAYLQQSPQEAGFRLLGADILPPESLPAPTVNADPLHALELEFLSPLPFSRNPGSRRTDLSARVFFTQLQQRCKGLFSLTLPLPDLDDVQLNCEHWHYAELRHRSRSQPGHTQYFNGCAGSLYLTSPRDLAPLLPWLHLAAAVQAGGSLQLNGQGYCRLHLPPPPPDNPEAGQTTGTPTTDTTKPVSGKH